MPSSPRRRARSPASRVRPPGDWWRLRRRRGISPWPAVEARRGSAGVGAQPPPPPRSRRGSRSAVTRRAASGAHPARLLPRSPPRAQTGRRGRPPRARAPCRPPARGNRRARATKPHHPSGRRTGRRGRPGPSRPRERRRAPLRRTQNGSPKRQSARDPPQASRGENRRREGSGSRPLRPAGANVRPVRGSPLLRTGSALAPLPRLPDESRTGRPCAGRGHRDRRGGDGARAPLWVPRRRARPERGDAGRGTEARRRRGPEWPNRARPGRGRAAAVRRRFVRWADVHVPPPLRDRSPRDAPRAGPCRSAGRDDCDARVRRSARPRPSRVGTLGADRPARRRDADLPGLARSRLVPRPEHPGVLPGERSSLAVALGRARRRAVAADEPRRRPRDVGPQGVSRPAFYALASGGWRDYVTLLHVPYTAWHLSYVAIGAALAPELHTDRLLAALAWTLWLLPFVAVGAFLVFAYNLELFGGVFHTDLWFALAWGAFPLLTGYFVVAEELAAEALLAAAFAVATSLAQRALSTPVRAVRRGRSDDPPSAIVGPERALRALTVAMVALAFALLALR